MNIPPVLYRLMKKTRTGEKRPKRPRMSFSIIGKAHTVLLYEFLPSADMGQAVYSNPQPEILKLYTPIPPCLSQSHCP